MLGFSAKRLTIARQRRGVTKSEIASHLGVSPAMVTGYENGLRRPNEVAVTALCEMLDFPRKFFFAPDIDQISPQAVTFRSLRSISATRRDQTVASGAIAYAVISPEFHKCFELPGLDIPDLTGEDPWLAATIVRQHWQLGENIVENMVHLLESRGVEVYWVNDPSPCIDAVSAWWDGRPIVIMNQLKGTEPRCGERQRYDAAHELGHLVLHRDADRLDSHKVESEANAFASAFLMPEAPFRVDCPKNPDLRLLLEIKADWRVSIQAMVRRGYDLGIFTQWQYEQFWKYLSYNRLREREPGQLGPEESAVHPVIYDGLSEDGVTQCEFADRVGLSWGDLLELTPAASRLPIRSRETSGWLRSPARPKLRLVAGR